MQSPSPLVVQSPPQKKKKKTTGSFLDVLLGMGMALHIPCIFRHRDPFLPLRKGLRLRCPFCASLLPISDDSLVLGVARGCVWKSRSLRSHHEVCMYVCRMIVCVHQHLCVSVVSRVGISAGQIPRRGVADSERACPSSIGIWRLVAHGS